MQERLEKKINTVKENKKYSVNINSGQVSKDEKEEAKSHQLSPTKYHIIMQIIELDDSYSIESLREKNMKELKDILNILSNK